HQRDGRIDRHRAPLRGDRRTPGHHPRQRDEPSRRAIRTGVGVRAGWHGVGHRAGAPLMAALTWEIREGIAVVTLDKTDAPVNVISQSVKDEVYAMLTALERDAKVRAVAFFSGKPDNFIAGADIEEFVKLQTAAEAEQLSHDGQAMLDRVAAFPKPIA